jgi:hypothetical protein
MDLVDGQSRTGSQREDRRDGGEQRETKRDAKAQCHVSIYSRAIM